MIARRAHIKRCTTTPPPLSFAPLSSTPSVYISLVIVIVVVVVVVVVHGARTHCGSSPTESVPKQHAACVCLILGSNVPVKRNSSAAKKEVCEKREFYLADAPAKEEKVGEVNALTILDNPLREAVGLDEWWRKKSEVSTFHIVLLT
jgi:hypothetical protein